MWHLGCVLFNTFFFKNKNQFAWLWQQCYSIPKMTIVSLLRIAVFYKCSKKSYSYSFCDVCTWEIFTTSMFCNTDLECPHDIFESIIIFLSHKKLMSSICISEIYCSENQIWPNWSRRPVHWRHEENPPSLFDWTDSLFWCFWNPTEKKQNRESKGTR